MSSYNGSVTISADAQSVFDFVSNPENLPQFVPGIQQADIGVGDAIHIQGECPHGPYKGVGSLHLEPDEFRMRWDSRANLNYRGSLQVIPKEGICVLTLFLDFNPGMEKRSNEEFEPILKHHPGKIQETLEQTLQAIKRLCEHAAIASRASLH
jgi:hypothetical protein